VKQNADTNRRPRRRLASLLAVVAVGLALLVVTIAATSGFNTAAPRGATSAAQVARANPPAGGVAKATKPAVKRAPSHKSASQPKAPAPAAQPGSAIPQNNGGDGDTDNNGGPSDGDGNI